MASDQPSRISAPTEPVEIDPATAGRASYIPNGPGAAAILAAGVGSLMLGVLAFAGDAWPDVKSALVFWKPTGALSGVTALTIAIWLAAWFCLSRLWASRNVDLTRVNTASFLMLLVGLLLTFPPFMDLLQGK